jgi:predicted CxxxxCH...CXXCH cytochrome family protein
VDRTAPFTSGPSAAWNAAAPGCGACHLAGSAMATQAHGAHVNNAAYLGTNLGCVKCHDTVSNDTTINAAKVAQHVNAIVETTGTSYSDSTADGIANGSCATNYCHSNGTETLSGTDYKSIAWNGTLANDCRGCHGIDTGGFTSVYGEPNYANNTASDDTRNTHAKHVSTTLATAKTQCVDCHESTINSTGTLVTAGTHVNNAVEVTAGAGKKIGAYTAAGETCATITCHGGGTAQWGATALACLSCHSGTEGDPLGNGAPNGVNGQWSTSGHGSATGGSFTSALGGCDYCHDLASNHVPTAAANPYRLRYSATDNTLCYQCHKTSDAGISANSAGTVLATENGAKNVDAAHAGTKHQAGEGGYLCWDCHDPHGTTNIHMVKTQVSKTSNTYGVPVTKVTVNFTDDTTAGPAVGRFVEATNNPRQGVCQACHDPTKTGDGTTVTGSVKWWRSDGTDDKDGTMGATVPSTSTHNSAKVCSSCHAHKDQFAGKGGGPDCIGCHGATGQGGTRAITPDFGLQSHHVRTVATLTATQTGPGTFSTTATGAGVGNNSDCVVCHSEGQIVTAASADCPTGTFPTTCTNPSFHANGKIDLRDVDTAAPAADAAGTATFVYDKTAVAGSAGAAAGWNSGNQLWREWTSGVDETGGATLPAKAGLDKFCLNCHDADGAAQISSFRLSAETSRVAVDPFWDGTNNLGNTYDQLNRANTTATRVTVPTPSATGNGGHVIDIKSKVSGAPPAQGTFARHAIRGQSASVYSHYTGNIGTGFQTLYDAGRFTSSMGNDELGRKWNDTSVMGCADCHTTDGANGASGNAHGSGSEYLLKDGAGGAAEGSVVGVNEICRRCHQMAAGVGYESVSKSYSHTAGNASDFNDSVAQVGGARLTASTPKGNAGTVFGIACLNCHGGSQGTGAAAGDTNSFGWIHGTNQVFPAGSNGAGTTTRNAYRFMNGSSLRFYQPGATTWDTGTGTCYTLGGSGVTSGFGNCGQHSGGTAAGPSAPALKRPLPSASY